MILKKALKNSLFCFKNRFLPNAFFFFSMFILFVLFYASFSASTTWIDAALSTDLKVVQNSTSNDTMYAASLDVSEGKLFMGATNSSYDLTSGLVGWWSFDNGNKTTDAKAWDYSGNNNHGTLTNMNIGTDNCTGNCSGWTTNGNLSNGVYFDGNDDLIDCSTGSSLDAINKMTYSVWFKINQRDNWDRILGKRTFDGGTQEIDLILGDDNKAWFYTEVDGSCTMAMKSNTFSLDEWVHIVVTIDNTSQIAKIYHNGTYIENDTSFSLPILTQGTSFRMGRANTAAHFNGTIDEVRVYNKVLSPDEINTLYHITKDNYVTNYTDISGSSINYDTVSHTNNSLIVNVPEIETDIYFTPTYVATEGVRNNNGLVARYSMDYANGTTLYDLSGNGNDGTIINAKWSSDTHNNTGHSLYFDGADDHVDCGAKSLGITDSVTISAWVELNSYKFHRIFTHSNWDGYLLRVEDDGTHNIMMRVEFTDESDTGEVQNGDIPLNEWVYVTGRYDGSTGNTSLFVNATYIGSTTNSSLIGKTIKDYDTDLNYIGESINDVDDLNGTIDSVAIWNRALSEAEIQDHYSNGLSKYKNITFNTTDASWFGQETVTITSEYLNEQNLTRVRVSNNYAMNQYDLLSFNVTQYLGWNPDNIQNIWYDYYAGNTDNSTLKATSDYSTRIETCESGNNTGLVGCWNFNELDGTTAKDRANNSLNNNDGTQTNMNIGIDNCTGNCSGWTRNGKFGGALRFSHEDNTYVTISESDSLNMTQHNAFSTGVWIKPSSDLLGGDHRFDIISHSARIVLGVWDTYNLLEFLFKNASNSEIKCEYTVGEGLVLNTNQWYHIYGVWNGTYSLIYINGIEVESCNHTGQTVVNSGTGFYIGSASDACSFNGTIDEVKFYNRALSTTEISNQYNLKKDYFDSLPNEEGGITASQNWDIFISNGTLDTTPPQLSFVSPTPSNNKYVSENYTYLNTTTSDTNNITSFIDWNNSLIGWWRFNQESEENATFFNDYSSHGNNGTCTNCPVYESGKFGSALEFDGSNDYLDCGNTESLNITGDELTISAWIKRVNDTFTDNIVCKSDAGISEGFRLRVTNNKKVTFFVGNGSQNRVDSATLVENNTWTHMVAVVNKTHAMVYINTILQTNDLQPFSGNIKATTINLRIGSSQSTSQWFNGTIDEVRIYNRALSGEEINASYNTGLYRLYHNFTSLSEGTYTYTAYAQDLAGNINSTTRTITIDTTNPSIEYVNPTDTNNAYVSRDYSYVNVTATDTNNISSFIDWNNSLVGWWRFNEGSGGTAYDSSSHGNNGTIYVYNESMDNWTTGKFDNALQFDGINDYVTIPNSASVNITGTEITISAWIRNYNLSDSLIHVILMKRNAYSIVIETDGTFRCGIDGLTDPYSSGSPPAITDNNWHYVSCTYNSTHIMTYLDATRQIIDDSSGNIASVTATVEIGRRDDNTRLFNGTIDDIMIFNRSLSSEEISALYNTGPYQVYRNFTDLSDGTYNYTAYAQDSAGNVQSSARAVTVDTTIPSLTYKIPTPVDKDYTNNTWIYINTTTSDTNNISSFIDWNNSLVGWWRMDNKTGTYLKDYSSYVNDGTLTNMNTGLNNGNSGWTDAGKFGNGINFNGDYIYGVSGTDQYVTIGTTSSLNFNQSDSFTMIAYLKKNENPDVGYSAGIVGKKFTYSIN
ncbi:MAG: LamG domain-containing protein, partial [Candidatus Aenigmarchaeota archaeon]|nr:LamG domain-containing protein [Candidatus Aenigmarchaeota archaeon]